MDLAKVLLDFSFVREQLVFLHIVCRSNAEGAFGMLKAHQKRI